MLRGLPEERENVLLPFLVCGAGRGVLVCVLQRNRPRGRAGPRRGGRYEPGSGWAGGECLRVCGTGAAGIGNWTWHVFGISQCLGRASRDAAGKNTIK